MRRFWKSAAAFSLLCLIGVALAGRAEAQTVYFGVHSIALKSGESTELTQVYYIGANCKSLLTATPDVEILDGPPGVTAVITEAKVVPRSVGCVKPVPGGKLIVSAKSVEDYSRTRMVLRINFKTRQGDRQISQDINISLFPSQ